MAKFTGKDRAYKIAQAGIQQSIPAVIKYANKAKKETKHGKQLEARAKALALKYYGTDNLGKLKQYQFDKLMNWVFKSSHKVSGPDSNTAVEKASDEEHTKTMVAPVVITDVNQRSTNDEVPWD
jgi:hypothetical protein